MSGVALAVVAAAAVTEAAALLGETAAAVDWKRALTIEAVDFAKPCCCCEAILGKDDPKTDREMGDLNALRLAVEKDRADATCAEAECAVALRSVLASAPENACGQIIGDEARDPFLLCKQIGWTSRLG